MVYVIIAVLAILVIFIISAYNKCVRLLNMSEEAFAQIDTHLKKRYDLIPNLVETVKGYAKHEKETLEAVIQARNMAMNAQGIEEKDKADNAFAGTLKTLFAISEAYPDLKANTNFQDLQKQLFHTRPPYGTRFSSSMSFCSSAASSGEMPLPR